MADFELWLDESGDFKNEKRKRKKSLNPSLIGGILISKDESLKINFDEILSEDLYHATEMSNLQKRECIIPVLEKIIKTHNAKQVFFENTEYEDVGTNRQLYLRMMAEGLLQLMLRLNAENNIVHLNVLIATRQDVEASGQSKKITDQEYIAELKRCILNKKNEHKIILDDKSVLSFETKVANVTQKLQIADFVCNTRLTRQSSAFSECRSLIEELYADAYFFSLYEINSENYINRCLTQNMVAESIYELYTTADKIDYKQYLDKILNKMNQLSYRVLKAQLKQCAADLVSKIALEDDYEISESIIKKIISEFVPKVLDLGDNFAEFEFILCLNLSDMYLREGDIMACREMLRRCENSQRKMGKSLETLLSYYQLQEKIALYNIDSFQYTKATKLMENSVKGFSEIIDTVGQSKFWSKGQASEQYISEYLGDALCMQIYAMMFMQRENPNLYPEMVRLSDWAMKQYPNHKGELERHRQYRSHIELEAGNYELALQYLMCAKMYEMCELTKENLNKFWIKIYDSEVEISKQYYLMYYILILQKAQMDHNKIADVMQETLDTYLKKDKLLEVIDGNDTEYFENIVEDLKLIRKRTTNILYHPMEIIYWKYGSYWGHCREYDKAKKYLRKAIKICLEHHNYLTMVITSIGIQAELLDILIRTNSFYDIQQKKLGEEIDKILKQDLDDDTRRFVENLQTEYNNKEYLKMSEMITY